MVDGNHHHCNSQDVFFGQDGNGYVSTSELKFVMAKLDVHFTDQVREVFGENDFLRIMICASGPSMGATAFYFKIPEL